MRLSLARFVTGLSVIVAPVAFGCATPAPLVRLSPTSREVVWVSGRASIAHEEGGIRVAAAFDHQDGHMLGLRVEVENATEGKLEVDPSEFTYTDCRGQAVATCGPTRRVFNPEQVLAALDERASRERADAANSQAMLGTLVILSAVADVASAASGHPALNAGDGTIVAASVMASDAAANNTSLASIPSQQQVWSNEALRRNTLFPGRGAGGRIYLPIDLDAQVVWLHVRTGGHDFSFPFRQVVTRIAPYADQPNQTLLTRNR